MADSTSAKKPFAHQAAMLCMLAPLLAMGMNAAAYMSSREAVSSPIIGYLSLAFVLVGPIFGVIALIGMRKHGTKDILGRSLAGIGLSGICLAAVIAVFVLASRGAMPSLEDLRMRKQLFGTWQLDDTGKSNDRVSWLHLSPDGTYQFRTVGAAAADFSGRWSVQNKNLYLLIDKLTAGRRDRVGNKLRTPIAELTLEKLVLETENGYNGYSRLQAAGGKSLDDLEREYHTARSGMLTSSTWMGTIELSGARIVLASLDPKAPQADLFREAIGMPVSMLQVVVDNTAGAGAFTMEPASARLYADDSLVTEALPSEKVLANVSREKEAWQKKYSGNITTAAGQKCLDRLIFLPAGTDLSHVTRIDVTINGAPVSIPGRLYTAQEMKDMYEQGLKRQGCPQGSGDRE